MSHVFMGTLAAENLVGFVADIDIKILGVPPLGPGMPFLDSDTCGGGGVIYFCQGFVPCMMSSMDG
jgi:hypothetical protein